MYYIKNVRINKFIGLFLQCSLQSSVEKCFSFGNGMIPERVKKKKIVLPVDANGEPNRGFMEQYIKNIEQKKVIDYIAFASKKMKKNEYKRISELKGAFCTLWRSQMRFRAVALRSITATRF